MKKFLAMLLSFVMLFSLTMPAMAAEVTGNTDNPTEGEVSATWNPEIAFTGIVVDDNTSHEYRYDETSKTYTIIIPADEVGGTGYLEYNIIGTNLTLIEDTNTLLKVQHENEDGLSPAPDALLVDVLQDFGYFGWSVLGYGDGEWEKLLYSNDGGMTWTTYTFEVKQAYTITNNTTDANGTVKIGSGDTDLTYALEGDNIALNESPAEGYMLDTLSVTDASGNSVDVENNAFTMPASAVTVNATFRVAVPHAITVPNENSGGTVASNLESATAGTTVTLTVAPADDYRLSAVTVNDGAVEVTKVNDTTYTFVMPDADVTVNATFEKIPHSVNVETSENGTVSADKQTAVAGDTVTLTWTAEDGYTLDKITVTDASGEEVTVDQGVLACTFVMPSSDVTVTATFKVQLVTSVAITWGSMSFTYDDTIDESTNEEKGWTCAADANSIVVENTGETTFTAQAKYESYEDYESISGSFNPASKELAIGEKYTFTLELSGKPTKVLKGDKIGKVTITINESAEG